MDIYLKNYYLTKYRVATRFFKFFLIGFLNFFQVFIVHIFGSIFSLKLSLRLNYVKYYKNIEKKL